MQQPNDLHECASIGKILQWNEKKTLNNRRLKDWENLALGF